MKRQNRHSVRQVFYVKARYAIEAIDRPCVESLGTIWPTGGYYMASKTASRKGKWWKVVCRYAAIPF